jgi:hypothetical protein
MILPFNDIFNQHNHIIKIKNLTNLHHSKNIFNTQIISYYQKIKYIMTIIYTGYTYKIPII